MCKSCTRGRRRSSVGMIPGVDTDKLQKIGVMVGGGVAAKMVNPMAKKYLAKWLPGDDPDTPGREGRKGRMIISGGKVLLGGVVAQKVDNELINDAGFGFAIVGGIELVDELIPSLSLDGVGYLEDYENVGNIIEIDLDEVDGFDQDLENYQEVAGDDYVDDDMELAGDYEEDYEDLYY